MRQDHDRTVREARDNMAEFDRRRALERWLQNYVHPELGIPPAYWCACTKSEKRWKIEYGLLSGADPVAWCWADPGAPEPPILEFRRPKPEPVKPRFRGDDPWRALPSLGTPILDSLIADMDSKIMASMFIPKDLLSAGIAPTTATEIRSQQSSFTYEMLTAMLRDLPPETRRPRRPWLDDLIVTSAYDYENDGLRIKTEWAHSLMAMTPSRVIGFDLGRGPDVTAIVEVKVPAPPEPTKRNQ